MWAYLDTETHLIAPGRLAPKLVCVQLAEDGGEVGIHLATDPATRTTVERVLRQGHIVGHNIAFDLAVIGAHWPDLLPMVWAAYDEARVYDTVTLAQFRDIARGEFSTTSGRYTLAGLAERMIGLYVSKGDDSWQLRYSELDGVPLDAWPAEAIEYATKDVEVTRKLFLTLFPWGSVESPQLRNMPTHVRASFALHLASAWGMRCDPVEVGNLRDEIDRQQGALRQRLIDEGLLRANGTRDDAAVRQRALAVGVSARTATGRVAVNATALQDVSDPLLRQLVEYQTAGKLRSTYLPVVEKGCTEPLHPRYGLVESGRTSCRNPNLQNLPRGGRVRECFVPRPGFVFVAADYHVVELVCLAQVLSNLFGAENCQMAQSLLQGRDLHLVTAANILKIGYHEAVARYKAGFQQVKDARQLAKGLNFGIPGGLGPDKLVQLLKGYGFEVSKLEASQLKTEWLRLYPEMRLYFRHISAETGRFADGAAGCIHPITHFVRGGLDYCSYANHLFQHLAAHGAKSALYCVQRACFTPGTALYGSRLVAFVHDELLLEVPEHCIDAAATELVNIMCAEFSAAATPDVPVHAEAVAMRRWCKDAKPRQDAQGRLIPWEE